MLSLFIQLTYIEQLLCIRLCVRKHELFSYLSNSFPSAFLSFLTMLTCLFFRVHTEDHSSALPECSPQNHAGHFVFHSDYAHCYFMGTSACWRGRIYLFFFFLAQQEKYHQMLLEILFQSHQFILGVDFGHLGKISRMRLFNDKNARKQFSLLNLQNLLICLLNLF